MPAFLEPFPGWGAQKMSNTELVRALRLDIAGELEAIATYDAHAEACSDAFVKEILTDIANEERVHVGELLRLVQKLASDEEKYLVQGMEEVDKQARPAESSVPASPLPEEKKD